MVNVVNDQVTNIIIIRGDQIKLLLSLLSKIAIED